MEEKGKGKCWCWRGEERVRVGDRKGERMWSKRERDEKGRGGEVHRCKRKVKN